MFYLIKVGTVTNAQRLKSALKAKGVKSNVIRIEKPQPSDGCGYAVKLFSDDIECALNTAENESINVRGVDAL